MPDWLIAYWTAVSTASIVWVAWAGRRLRRRGVNYLALPADSAAGGRDGVDIRHDPPVQP